ncbi:unnamed protein product, partial [Gulo gulo]
MCPLRTSQSVPHTAICSYTPPRVLPPPGPLLSPLTLRTPCVISGPPGSSPGSRARDGGKN